MASKMLKRKAGAAAAGLCLLGGLSGLAAPAQAATYLGGTNLYAACIASYPGGYNHSVYTVYPHNAYSWRCAWSSGGNRYWDYFDMNGVCRWQYGRGAYAVTWNSSSPTSWRCYR